MKHAGFVCTSLRVGSLLRSRARATESRKQALLATGGFSARFRGPAARAKESLLAGYVCNKKYLQEI